MTSAPELAVRDGFRQQALWCDRMGSAATARLCAALAEHLHDTGPVTRRIVTWTGDPDPGGDALALRVAGALHRLHLEGASGVAGLWDEAVAADPAGQAAQAMAALEAHPALAHAYLDSPPQTNEVGRSGPLMAGLLVVAHETGLPLALLEIGASAGLNQIPDHHAHVFGAARWDGGDSGLTLAPDWTGPPPPVKAPLSVVSRAGVDLSPMDLSLPGTANRLLSYVWMGQPQRIAAARTAIAAARRAGVRVEQGDCAAWLERVLAQPAPQGATRVIYHSVVWQYLPEAVAGRARTAIKTAGAGATARAPVAWLRLEKRADAIGHALDLTLWPGGATRRLATTHAHGAWVAWEDGLPGFPPDAGAIKTAP